MNEITTKKDVNEILADSKSLTQYLEDVYEVEKNLYSVYQAKQRMEVIINQSGQERVMERKCPIGIAKVQFDRTRSVDRLTDIAKKQHVRFWQFR